MIANQLLKCFCLIGVGTVPNIAKGCDCSSSSAPSIFSPNIKASWHYYQSRCVRPKADDIPANWCLFQVNVGSDALSSPLSLGLPFPKVAVVHQNRVRVHLDRRFNQIQTGSNTGNKPPYFLASFYLQSIGTVIPKLPYFKEKYLYMRTS